MRVKARCLREAFRKDDFRILNWSPYEKKGLQLSKYFTFSTKGQDTYIDVGKDYEIDIELISVHPQFGGTYAIKSCPSMAELDIASLSREEKFNILMQCTSSERIANNILDVYSDYIERVLTDGGENIDVKPISGVGLKFHKSYCRQLLDKYKYFNIFNKFSDWGIDMIDARNLSGKFGNEEEIKKAFEKDPYEVLIDICEKQFLNADKIILEQAPQFKETETRCAHLMLEVLDKNEKESSSTRLNGNDLYFYIKDNLNYPELVPLIVPTAQNSELIYYDEETKDLAKMSTYSGECRINDFIKEKLENSHSLDIDCEKYSMFDGMELSDEQFNALKMFCKYDLMLLVGAAGVGKTQSLKAILDLCDDNGLTYSLFSFSGAAALRMTEATGRPSSTIHRPYYQEREFHDDVIIVDEFSFMDVETTNMLITMIANPDAKIIFVGDPCQIQSVGCGNVFYDIINSKQVPTNELTKVFRYNSNGMLFVATNIRKGIDFFDDPMVKHVGNEYRVSNNWIFIETDKIFDTVIDEYTKLLNKGVKPKDILCLSPQKADECGTYKLNNTIQNIVNPIKPNQLSLSRTIGSITMNFRVGDKVVNTRNDYKVLSLESYLEVENSGGILTADDVDHTAIFNGQVGYIRDLNEKYCVIQFNEDLVVFDKNKVAHDLLLAYAVTYHKAQGAESDYVINVLSENHKRMRIRNLGYVAETRAKKKQIDVGSVEALKEAIAVDGNKLRDTFLKILLKTV